LGEDKEQRESMETLAQGSLLVLCIIYALMAIPFKSYLQPLIIMSVIPFGLIGAVFGHLIMFKPISMLSLLGILALTGVLVNDSLILVDYINEQIRKGVQLSKALRTAGMLRFRPILLTSMTTFAGLTPILLERSLQAQFLIPMAISLAFGILFGTLITLILVPTLYVVLEDFKRFYRFLFDLKSKTL
jgi:multidrug efflux pump subunit AcrB